MREQTADVLARGKKKQNSNIKFIIIFFFYLIGTKQRNESKRRIHGKKEKSSEKYMHMSECVLVGMLFGFCLPHRASPTESHFCSANTQRRRRATDTEVEWEKESFV